MRYISSVIALAVAARLSADGTADGGVGCRFHVVMRQSLLDSLAELYVAREGGSRFLGSRGQRGRAC